STTSSSSSTTTSRTTGSSRSTGAWRSNCRVVALRLAPRLFLEPLQLLEADGDRLVRGQDVLEPARLGLSLRGRLRLEERPELVANGGGQHPFQVLEREPALHGIAPA